MTELFVEFSPFSVCIHPSSCLPILGAVDPILRLFWQAKNAVINDAATRQGIDTKLLHTVRK